MDHTARLGLDKIQADHDVPVTDLATAITQHANVLDTAAVVLHGAAEDRPPAAVPDRFYWAEDTKVLSHDDGAAWTDLGGTTTNDTIAFALALG